MRLAQRPCRLPAQGKARLFQPGLLAQARRRVASSAGRPCDPSNRIDEQSNHPTYTRVTGYLLGRWSLSSPLRTGKAGARKWGLRLRKPRVPLCHSCARADHAGTPAPTTCHHQTLLVSRLPSRPNMAWPWYIQSSRAHTSLGVLLRHTCPRHVPAQGCYRITDTTSLISTPMAQSQKFKVWYHCARNTDEKDPAASKTCRSGSS